MQPDEHTIYGKRTRLPLPKHCMGLKNNYVPVLNRYHAKTDFIYILFQPSRRNTDIPGVITYEFHDFSKTCGNFQDFLGLEITGLSRSVGTLHTHDSCMTENTSYEYDKLKTWTPPENGWWMQLLADSKPVKITVMLATLHTQAKLATSTNLTKMQENMHI